MIACISGDIKGPPAESEYAVEPTGVEAITPSAPNTVISLPLIKSLK
jgi:hypothetical protein